jgi:hypothetical protein
VRQITVVPASFIERENIVTKINLTPDISRTPNVLCKVIYAVSIWTTLGIPSLN